MSFLRSRTNLQTRDDLDTDDEILLGQSGENVLFQTTERASRSKQLVGKLIPNPKLFQERRNTAQNALSAVRDARNPLRGIRLLSGLASSPVADVVPESAASQQVAKPDDLPPVSDMALADSQTAIIQEPFRRSKWFGKAQSRSTTLAEIKNFMPIQFEFPRHPERDRSNEWFQNAYAVLFERLLGFARDYFGFQELQRGFHEPWAVNMPVEFLRYVELVAEPDPAVGGWDEMLINTETRNFLIVAIIVKILEVKVFAPSLWGNTKEGEDLLHGLDRALLDSEGYSRQELRSKSIRTLLGAASITPNFHSDCTTLTAQIMILLGPLFNYLTMLPARPNTVTPSAKGFYQTLHNIVASAAYLSLCIRISPTIIHTAHLVPGTPYITEEHTSLLQMSWTFSSTLVQENWARDHHLLESERAVAEGYKLGYDRARRQNSRAGREAVRRLEAAQTKLTEHKPPGFTHQACVKIAVWPVTRRYWAGNGEPGGEQDGQSIYTVTNAGAVFYYKERDKAVDSLIDFVAQKKKRFLKKRGWDLLAVLGLLSLGVFLVSLFLIGYKKLQGLVEGLGQQPMPEAEPVTEEEDKIFRR
ncbi:hypothetical protein NHQ30_002858 [Ciborinia camelliae]|nr:hypothetical protein NHQ30_002858 [Ciborinia camelliae]